MKIIIIGNGFDLNLGLKTSYKDFIESSYFKALVEENNSLAIYLMDKNNLNNWVDIEKEITQYSTYIQNTDSNVKSNFEALKISLSNYLKEVQEGEIDQNSHALKMIREEIWTADKIFNFNYTNSVFRVAKILGIDDIEDKHVHVHGSIENSDIIFGVEGDAKVQSDHYFFKKSRNHNFGKSNIAKYLNSKNDLVLFGHSLGITDSSYFQKYINFLSLKRNECELKFYYFGDSGYHEMMAMIEEYTMDNLSDFKNYNNFMEIDTSEK